MNLSWDIDLLNSYPLISKWSASDFEIRLSISKSTTFNLSERSKLRKCSKASFVESSVLSQCGVLTNPILILLKSTFCIDTKSSSRRIDRKSAISSTDLDINPKVSIDGEFGRMPDLSKSP